MTPLIRRASRRALTSNCGRALRARFSLTFQTAALLVFVLSMVCQPSDTQAAVTSTNDINYWIGIGSNETVLAIDWNDGQAPTLAWGYRWTGTQTLEAMFIEIVTHDPRLFARVGIDNQFGFGIYGLGYDATADLSLALQDPSVTFDTAGLADAGPSDLTPPADENDIYREGWSLGFWRHTTSLAGSGEWIEGPGASARMLVDGEWEGLAFNPSIFLQTATPTNLQATEPTTLPGDYNHNGTVDAADYTLWRDQLGDAVTHRGYGADGNLSGSVDSQDYQTWQNHFGDLLISTSITFGATASEIPEPDAAILFLFSFAILLAFAAGRLKQI